MLPTHHGVQQGETQRVTGIHRYYSHIESVLARNHTPAPLSTWLTQATTNGKPLERFPQLCDRPIDEIGLDLTSRLGRNPSQSEVFQSPGSLHPPDTGRNPRRTGCPFLRDSVAPSSFLRGSVLLFGSVVELARSQNHHPEGTKKQKGWPLRSPVLSLWLAAPSSGVLFCSLVR